MNQDFFRFLPSEIIMDILTRLPVRTVAASKCVCKPWLHLLETEEFAKSHLAKSPAPVLAHLEYGDPPLSCTVFELDDGLDLDHHDFHYNPLTKFDFPCDGRIAGSAKDLLLLHMSSSPGDALYVCNPITREYVKLDHYPKGFESSCLQVSTIGFGASKISGQYKVVIIYPNRVKRRYECHVHTLGTGFWRSIEPASPTLIYIHSNFGAFVNGNLYWVVIDSGETAWISCFDLEMERFTMISTPPLEDMERYDILGLSALGDELCVCDNTFERKFAVWLLKDCGGGRQNWMKHIEVSKKPDSFNGFHDSFLPIKVFRDGDMLLVCDGTELLYYSSKEDSIQSTDLFNSNSALLFTPSFLSIRRLGFENVQSF